LIGSNLKAIFNNLMFVCCCIGVTDRTIREAIAAGAQTTEAVSACTRAGTRCGSCRPEIEEMLAEARQLAMTHACPDQGCPEQESAADELAGAAPRRLPILAA
jgi:bacterioferritin-associated ferredoxin